MRCLFTMDTKDYPKDGKRIVRPSARSIIIKENRLALVYSQKYHYYKFPGGGIEAQEDPKKALIRETLEETGLSVIPASIREYGYVHRIQKGEPEGIFIQDNYYYFCETREGVGSTHLDDYEEAEGFTLAYVTPEEALQENQLKDHASADPLMIQRESRVMNLLVAEGYLDKKR
ncbi:NUDIX domain-containing protein [Enterococcus asini]|uniref:NUDIX domain-containing protein n=1 Tax=Enterococcus asini TaxID=57732 RepID=UPI0032E3BF50